MSTAAATSGEAAGAGVAPHTPSTPARRILAQARLELLLTLRRSESVLLTFAIPVLLLAFFSAVHVLPTPAGTARGVDFLFPGILALAIMSTAMVSLAIATGFERDMGVLKRLGASPLRRSELLIAKTASVLAIEALQIIVLFAEGLAFGWRGTVGGAFLAVAVMALATVSFAGLGMLLAGTLPALTTLAAANGLWLVLLLVSGMVVPFTSLPGWLQGIAKALPSGALADGAREALSGASVGGHVWLVLALWAVAAPAVAAASFRWE